MQEEEAVSKTLLERWAHAARCRRPTSQQKANNLWRELGPCLPEDVYHSLRIAWSHAIMAEQCPKELDTMVKKLLKEGL